MEKLEALCIYFSKIIEQFTHFMIHLALYIVSAIRGSNYRFFNLDMRFN